MGEGGTKLFAKCHQLKEHIGDLFRFLVFGRLALSFLSSSFALFFFFSIVPVFSKSSPRVFPGGSDSNASAYDARDPGSIPGVGRSPAEGNGNLLQYSYLENPMAEEPGRLQSLGSQRVGHN